MKQEIFFIILFICCPFLLKSQNEELSKTRLVAGPAVPELIHIGANVDLGNYNQFGASAGFLIFYGYHPTLNIEHRFYFEKLGNFTNRRNWFLRQGATYFIIGDEIGGAYQSSLALSLGLDFISKIGKMGWTIDLGAFIAFPQKGSKPPNENNIIGPSIRIQFYSYFKKKKN